jgi:hypothetical protein
MRPILARRMSGDALTMREVGVLNLLRQFLGSNLAGRYLGLSKSADKLPATQGGDLGASALQNVEKRRFVMGKFQMPFRL